MNRKILAILLVVLFSAAFVFAQEAITPITAPVGEEFIIPEGIHNNTYFQESVRLTKLAHETYEYGDYDASAGFAQEAIRYTELSNEHVSDQLIKEARRLLNIADANNIAARFPNNYNEGKNYYETSVANHAMGQWSESIDASIKSIEILAAFEASGQVRTATTGGTTTPAARVDTGTTTTSTARPRQYTVRTWIVERDCLWNIAGYPWVYGDPWKWTILYEANKARMPDPNNPDLIEPGMILEIPNLEGENRQGMWRP